jgi:Malic enzyme, N-terminal domain
MLGAIDLVRVEAHDVVRDVTVACVDSGHAEGVVRAVRALEGVTVDSVSDRTFLMHKGGKIEVDAKLPLKTRDDLSMAYTPGVARVSMAIREDPAKAWALTIESNTVAVVSDGTAVLGLGDIGPEAAMPVMEGKAMLFKEFAGVDAFPQADPGAPPRALALSRWTTFESVDRSRTAPALPWRSRRQRRPVRRAWCSSNSGASLATQGRLLSARSRKVGVATAILPPKAKRVSDDRACAAGLGVKRPRRRRHRSSRRGAVRSSVPEWRQTSSLESTGVPEMLRAPRIAPALWGSGCRERDGWDAVGENREAGDDLDERAHQWVSCRVSMRWTRSNRACTWVARRRPLAWRVARPCSADQATSARVPSASGNTSWMPENARWSGSGVSAAANGNPEGSENIASYSRGWAAAKLR